MRWVLFLFLFGLGFPASVVYEAKLQMPKVDNDAVVQYLNYLYERSSAFLTLWKFWKGCGLILLMLIMESLIISA
jgi:hypothetical protein